jgi:hypothetical protein
MSTLGAVLIAVAPFTFALEVKLLTIFLIAAGAILLPLPIITSNKT